MPRIMRCRLCIGIGLIVCTSIFIIEAVILVPSYFSRQAELFDQLETEGMRIVAKALHEYDHHSLEHIIEDLNEDVRRTRLQGGAIYGDAGELLAVFGEPPVLSLETIQARQVARHELVGEDRLEILWTADLSAMPVTVVANINAESVEDELGAYVGRISGLVLIISLFVSAATVAANGLLVINPLFEIRKKLMAAQDDPTNAERYRLDIRRNDEIGETVDAVNTLLTRLSDVRRSDIKEREQRLKDFGEASSDWYWEMDEQLRFSYFSDRFVEVTGVPQDALLGKTRQETGIPGVDADAWRKHLADLAACRPFRDFVHPRTLPDGTTVFLSINGKPIFGEDGTFKGFRGTGRDITEQKLREEALVEAKHHAEIANRAKSEFLANMSHELRTPLNAIIGFAEIMKDGRLGPIGNPRYVEYLNDIHLSGHHLLELISDVLDLSKIESGTVKLDREDLDVAKVIGTCVNLIRPRAEAGQLEIIQDLPPSLPLLRADSRALKQILVNLLSNAVKFTLPGGKIQVSARSDPGGGHAIQVSDTGIGIDAADIPRALDRFQQIDGRLDRKYEGTGLGLALSKSLIDLHAGTLELESQVGVGTTVTIRFPANRPIAPRCEADSHGDARIVVNARPE